MYVIDVNMGSTNVATTAAFFVPVWSAGTLIQKQADWNKADTTDVTYIKNKPSLMAVATTGDYDDLINKPTIPTDTGDLTNGAGFITSSALSGYATQTWVGQQGYLTSSDLSGYQTTANLVTSVSSASTDSQYPSAKLFYDTCGDIETLINAL